MQEQRLVLELISKKESHTCLGGAQVGIESWSGLPLPDCSVRPFAGANCPHRTPLNCEDFDCGEYGLENQSGADNGTFILI